jgi:hypothetical protein
MRARASTSRVKAPCSRELACTSCGRWIERDNRGSADAALPSAPIDPRWRGRCAKQER